MEVKRYFEAKYRRSVTYIPYGGLVPQTEEWNEGRLAEPPLGENGLNLAPNDYWLAVGRIEPENNIHTIIQAFLESRSRRKLLVVGDSPNRTYKNHIGRMLSEHGAEERVIMPGGIYDSRLLNMLRQHCFAHIHGHSVGGTNPALLEAMCAKKVVIAHDNSCNREVAGETVLFFESAGDLAKKMVELEGDPRAHTSMTDAALGRVVSNYVWTSVAEQYDKLFTEFCLHKAGGKAEGRLR